MILRPTGIAGLDEILGGFPKPSTILVAGTAGVGKTMFVLESLSSVAEEETTLYIPITSRRDDFTRVFPSAHESIRIHPIDRLSVERDPLSALIDIGNAIVSSSADRIAIDPITPLGSAFPEQERRRFIGTFDSMTHEWDAITLVTGELTGAEIHTSIISHFMDGILHLSYDEDKRCILRNIKTIKTSNSANDRAQSNIYRFGISSNGIQVFPRLTDGAAHPDLSVRMPTGVPDLDRMLDGGIPETYSVLLSGSPGTGKTVFGIRFVYESLKNGKPCVIVSFNESPDQMIAYAMRFGWVLQKYVDCGLLGFVHVTEQISVDEHLWHIKSAIESTGASSILFDGISDMKTAFCESVRVDEYLHSLTGYLKHRGITSLFIEEVRNASTFRMRDADISFLADGIISFGYIRKGVELQKTILILKMRGIDHSRRIQEYRITNRGIEIAEGDTCNIP